MICQVLKSESIFTIIILHFLRQTNVFLFNMYSGYQEYIRPLLDMNVKMYELRSIYMQKIVLDDHYCFLSKQYQAAIDLPGQHEWDFRQVPGF